MKLLSISERAKSVVAFDPAPALKRDAEANALIKYAKRVKDWPTLVKAVEQKIEDQQQFVAEWDANVRPKGHQPTSQGLRP
jgi:hypothetical protein